MNETGKALRLWAQIPGEKQAKLIERLRPLHAHPFGGAIELTKTDKAIRAQAVSIMFGMDLSIGSGKLYLMLPDVEEQKESKEA